MATQFQSVLDGVDTILAAMTSVYSTPAPIFAQSLRTGDRGTTHPFAAAFYGKDTVVQRSVSPDAGAKMTMSVPLLVMVTFGPETVPDGVHHTVVHMTLLGELIAAIHADRSLGGTAQDCMYAGEGLELVVVGADDEPNYFEFVAKFDTTIRYAGVNPSTE